MEQNSTRRRRRPMQGTVPVSDSKLPMEVSSNLSDDLLFPEFPEIPKFQYDTRAFEEFQRSFQEACDRFKKESEEYHKQLLKLGEEWLKNGQEEFEKMRENLEFTEYVDENGYDVFEAHSKDGKHVFIQRTKRSGTRVDSIIEMLEDGRLVYKSSSLTDTYGFRNRDGAFVTKQRTFSRQSSSDGVRYEGSFESSTRSSRRYRQSRGYVGTGMKKTTSKWKWLLIIAIVAAAIYFVFFH